MLFKHQIFNLDKATDIEVWLQKQKIYDNIETVKHF